MSAFCWWRCNEGNFYDCCCVRVPLGILCDLSLEKFEHLNGARWWNPVFNFIKEDGHVSTIEQQETVLNLPWNVHIESRPSELLKFELHEKMTNHTSSGILALPPTEKLHSPTSILSSFVLVEVFLNAIISHLDALSLSSVNLLTVDIWASNVEVHGGPVPQCALGILQGTTCWPTLTCPCLLAFFEYIDLPWL